MHWGRLRTEIIPRVGVTVRNISAGAVVHVYVMRGVVLDAVRLSRRLVRPLARNSPSIDSS